MTDLDFAVQDVEVARRSATPLLLFKLRVANRTPAAPVEYVMLQAQIRIEASHRDYAAERERLEELFGAADDWDRGLRGLLWTTASAAIPGFVESCTIDLPVPCSYDFNIAATKYFHSLENGDVPLLLLFSGTVFFRNDVGDLQIAQIAHHKEAGYRLPVRIWQSMMHRYYPDSVWLRIDRDLVDAVCRYKRDRGIASLEEAVRRLLAAQLAEAAR